MTHAPQRSSFGRAVGCAALLAAALAPSPGLPAAVAQDGGSRDPDGAREDADKRWREGVEARTKQRETEGLRSAFAARADGSVVAAGNPKNAIEVWRGASDRPSLALEGHQGEVRRIAVHPTRPRIYSMSTDGTVRVWDLDSGMPILTYGEPVDPATPWTGQWLNADAKKRYSSMDLSSGGDHLAAYAYPGGLELLDPGTGVARWTQSGETGTVALWALADGRHVLAASMWALALHDAKAKPQTRTTGFGPREKRSEVHPATWRLGGGTWSREPSDGKLPAGSFTASLQEQAGLAVLLCTPGAAEPDAPAPAQHLVAFKLDKGKEKWDVELPAGTHTLLEARDAKWIVLVAGRTLTFVNPKNGKTLRSHDVPAPLPMPSGLRNDGLEGYAADREGVLTRIPLEEKALLAWIAAGAGR